MPSNTNSQHRRSLKGLIWLVFFLSFIFMAATAMASSWADGPTPHGSPGYAADTATPTRTSTVISIPDGRLLAGNSRTPRMPAQPIVDDYTVALYHLDASSGSNVIDAKGIYTGTLHGNAVITPSALYAGGLQLDGQDGPGSYLRTGDLGSLTSGTIEAFVDFATACNGVGGDFTIFSVGGDYNSGQQPVLWLGNEGYLKFKMIADGKLYLADSTINPCRYLAGGNTGPYFTVGNYYPYETWRFHHVAGAWGPRGIEIWIDGILHGVGLYVPDPNNPPSHNGYSCSPQQQVGMDPPGSYGCDFLKPGLVPGAYGGSLPNYSTFLIGCKPGGSCFRGRIDEVRISNIQRVFNYTVVPTVTPTPTNTPVPITGGYAVDPYTVRLYHLDEIGVPNWQWVLEANGNNAIWHGNPSLATGRFGNAYLLNNGSYIDTGDPGIDANGTVEAWVNLTSSASPFGIFNAGNAVGQGGTGMILGVLSGATTLRFGIDSGNGMYWVDSGIEPAQLTGCWRHIAGSWGTFGLEIWIDGQLRGVTNYYGTRLNTNPNFNFGCDSIGNCMNGKLDEVRVSSVRRTFSARALARGINPTPIPRLSANGVPQVFLPFVVQAPRPTPLPCLFGQ